MRVGISGGEGNASEGWRDRSWVPEEEWEWEDGRETVCGEEDEEERVSRFECVWGEDVRPTSPKDSKTMKPSTISSSCFTDVSFAWTPCECE